LPAEFEHRVFADLTDDGWRSNKGRLAGVMVSCRKKQEWEQRDDDPPRSSLNATMVARVKRGCWLAAHAPERY
jgi:hypothetical protein